MVGCGEHVLDPQPRAGTGPLCRGELGAPVCCDSGWDAKCATQLAIKASVHVLASMLLALLAVEAHRCCVFAYALPDKMCSHHILGGTYAASAESHSRLAPSTWTVLNVSVLGQLAWLAAIQEKEMPAAGCTSATPAATPGSEGGEEFSLPPCRAAPRELEGRRQR
jgi:hypothetical protein